MNAPAQGILLWFYTEIIPLGEYSVMMAVKKCRYDPFLSEEENVEVGCVADPTASLLLQTEGGYVSNSLELKHSR